MTYQFDPRPEGLHYEPFTASCCGRKSMWFLKDGAPEPWIDLRSVFEALGLAWQPRWHMFSLARQRRWSLEACYDRQLRETLLAQADRLPAILGEVSDGLLPGDVARARVRELRLLWRSIHLELRDGSSIKSRKSKPSVKKSTAVRKRAISAYLVKQVFKLQGKGHGKAAIGQSLNITVPMLQKIAAGTCPMDEEARQAWQETFGNDSDASATGL